MNLKSVIKMKIIFLLIISINLYSVASGQTKSKEVDILYQKYKNVDSVVVTNANGSVKLGVSKILNSNGKPQAIILTGYAFNSQIGNSLIEKLTNDKTKAGFNYSSSSTIYSDEILNVSVYTKGTQYAKYGNETDLFAKNDPPPYSTGTEEQKERRERKYVRALLGYCFIYMEVGDISRSSNRSEEFKF